MMNSHSEGFASQVFADVLSRAPYEPSVASSISSAQLSVFSDAPSTQSSIASSISDDFRIGQEDLRDRLAYQRQQQHAKAIVERNQYECYLRAQQVMPPSYAEVTSVPQELRQHPRRSGHVRSDRPPSLVRQSERKVNFVDNLVDSATQMVEVIWPLSTVPCHGDAPTIRKGVLPLRTYIEETLRRSRTSYSTLQVALYYLVLIKPFVSARDFTMEQRSDCAANRALMCGRRMFLAALILASKYLQDRNYSAKAWSKMSGLKIDEINANEATFLRMVNWKLHIPEVLFKRWTEIVLRYTPNMSSSPTVHQYMTGVSWKSVIPLLTAQLDTLPLGDGQTSSLTSTSIFEENSRPLTPPLQDQPITPICEQIGSLEATPVPVIDTVLPQFLEPRMDVLPPTPALIRMGPLPTPNMTPVSTASSTPAVSACSSRRSSMTSAMAFATRLGMNRCHTDVYPGQSMPSHGLANRYTSCDTSNVSSPESLLTDRSRSSRASSISSISTSSSMALNRACLARVATCRNASLCTKIQEEKNTSHLVVASDDMELTSSPEMVDFSVSEKVLHMPHRHSKTAVAGGHQTAVVAAEKNRKRSRPRGGRRSNLQEEVRMLLEEEFDTMMDVDDEDSESSTSPSDVSFGSLKSSRLRVDSPILGQYASGDFGRVRYSAQSHEAKKRRCCGSSGLRMSVTPSP